tara:strand:+ start:27713 stop:29101 length:1389 start_codon:yes stop_codon:yes gene_type:complete
MKLSNIKKIHFIGIGGVGMVGIAEMLIKQGFSVSGSDLVKNKNTIRLTSLGAKIFIGHNEKNVRNSDVVVYSSAVNDSNPEIKASKSLNITLIPRAEMLSSLMRGYQSIAVAGSHGKTTTTSLIADIFVRASLDPTFIIGGKILGQENKSILGTGEYLIVEADESDASFLHLNPEISVVTNIDNDHLDFYENNIEKLDSTFLQFLENLPFYGSAIICIDSDRSKKVFKLLSRPKISYGFEKKADYFIKDLKQYATFQKFKIVRSSTGKETTLELTLLGKHNALNAAAAFIVAQKAGINTKVIKDSFKNFGGVSRRLEFKANLKIEGKSATLIDDYGHHPTELKATIQALRSSKPNKKICMIFQPHRYSRSTLLFKEFVECLREVDTIIILDIYSAGEQNLQNISSYDFVNALIEKRKNAFFAKNLKEICKILETEIEGNEIIVTQGAGNIVDISNSIKAIYK